MPDPVTAAIELYHERNRDALNQQRAQFLAALDKLRPIIETAVIKQAKGGGYQVYVRFSPTLLETAAARVSEDNRNNFFRDWLRPLPWSRHITASGVFFHSRLLHLRWA